MAKVSLSKIVKLLPNMKILIDDGVDIDEKGCYLINVAYERVSTDRQADLGFGLDIQEKDVLSFARRNDYKNLLLFIDDGYTGTNMDRPALQAIIQMINDYNSGLSNVRIDTFVVPRIDRLGRTLLGTLQFIQDYIVSQKDSKGSALNHNTEDINFISVAENYCRIEKNNPQGKFLLMLFASLAEYDRDLIVDKMKKGKTARASKGKYLGGGPKPYGYKYDKNIGKLVVVPEEAEIVREVYRLYIEEHLSPGVIADRFGFKYEQKVTNILKSKLMAGYITFNGEEYPGEHEAIVSLERWQEAQDELKKRGVSRGDPTYMLAGLLVCGECGAKMHGNLRKTPSGNQYTTYRCNVKNNKRTCGSKEIHAAPLDKFVLDMVFKNYFTEERLPMIAEQVNRQMRENILNDETLLKAKEELQTKIHIRDTLIQTIVKTGEIDAISQQIKQLETEIKKLQQFVSNAEKGTAAKITADDVRDYLQPLRERFQSAECNEQVKVILSQIIDKIVVYRDRADIYLKMQFENVKENVKEESAEEKNVENVIPMFTPTYYQGISVSMTDVTKRKPDFKPIRDMSALLKGRKYEMPEFDMEAVRGRYTAS